MSLQRFAVLGNPIEHSRSPQIHAAFAQQFGLAIDYRRILVESGRFAARVDELRDSGLRGINVTLPFKQQAMAYCDYISDAATLAGAANTLIFDPGETRGENSDGIGLVRDLVNNLRVSSEGLDVLVLGAGGAVRGVLGPLLAQQPATLHVANRTANKAEQLAREFEAFGAITGAGLDSLGSRHFDLVINGTAASLSDELPALPDGLLRTGGVAYDMAYAANPTAFVLWGAAHDARLSVDGLGMLVEQAAESFSLWLGERPDTTPVLTTLRQQLDRS